MRLSVAILLVTVGVAVGCRGPDPSAPAIGLCAHAAPLLGKYDPRAPDYIVVYIDFVDSIAETDRLAALYDFIPKYVWPVGLRGFVAELMPAVVEELRCESRVKSVSHDMFVHAID